MALVATNRPLTTYSSPLSYRDTVLDHIKPLPPVSEWRRREASYVNDAIRTTVYNYPRGIPLIPRYDALRDPMCAAYFESPRVREVLRVTIKGKPPLKKPDDKNIHKLSTRGFCLPTPPPGVLKDREDSFVNDAIITEKKRTKYKDTLLPPYNAEKDWHCRDYFNSPEVQRTIRRTIQGFSYTAPTPPRSARIHLMATSPMPRTRRRRGGGGDGDNSANRGGAGGVNTADKSAQGRRTGHRRSSTMPAKSYSPSRPGQGHDQRKMTATTATTNSTSQERKRRGDGSESGSDGTKGRGGRGGQGSGAGTGSESHRSGSPRRAKYMTKCKQSYRHMTIPTPPLRVRKEQEEAFRNDAIITANQRTKYKDTLIPSYSATNDPFSQQYFQRQGVPQLVKMTLSVQPGQQDLKIDLARQQRKFEELERKRHKNHASEHAGACSQRK